MSSQISLHRVQRKLAQVFLLDREPLRRRLVRLQQEFEKLAQERSDAASQPIGKVEDTAFEGWRQKLRELADDCDASISAASPGRSVRSMRESPYATIMRFSSLSGITSAIVPMAARSAHPRKARRTPSISGSPRRRHRSISQAQMSLNTTPTPASSQKGYGLSGR